MMLGTFKRKYLSIADYSNFGAKPNVKFVYTEADFFSIDIFL